MNVVSQNARSLAGYLFSDECLPWLRQEARIIMSRAASLGLPSQVWPFPHPKDCRAGELNEIIDEVAHEFWLHLQSFLNKGMAPPPEVADSSGRPGRLTGAYLRNGFLLGLRDLARRKDVSQYRYLYRRMRETISREAQFFLRSLGGGSFYSLQAEAGPLAALEARFEEPYGSWPSPTELVPQSELAHFRGKDLVSLAIFFWEHATMRLGEAAYLPVRSLVDYIAAHYEHFRNPQEQEHTSGTLSHEGLQAPDITDFDGLEILAWQVASLWSPKRRKVFHLTLEPGSLTLEQIAQMAGLSGPSHVKYQLDRACDDLALVFESWPGVAPASHERSFWTNFLQYVAEICKKDFGDH